MSKPKMSPEELKKESMRSAALIRQGSRAGLQGVAELSKRQFSLEEMRTAIKRHQREADRVWNQGPTPANDKKSPQR